MIRLVLFDIDGTLLRGRDGANLAGWLRGLELGLGLPGAHPDDVPHAGFTDRATALALSAHHGLASAESTTRLADFFRIKDTVMAEQVAADPAGTLLVATSGANELLMVLRSAGIVLGLVTGNTPAAALSKLRRAGIDPGLFAVGGYGDACTTRDELVTAAIVQAIPLLPGLRPDEVAVVGDTAADVASARNVGTRAVADLGPTLAFAAILGTS